MTGVRVRLFGGLVQASKGVKEIEVRASTIKEILSQLIGKFGPDFGRMALEEDGNLRPFVNLYLNNRDIRFLASVSTPVKDGDTVMILPAVGGG